MHILLHFLCVFCAGQSLAVLTNGQQDLAINQPGVYTGTLSQSVNEIAQTLNDNQYNGQNIINQAPQASYQPNIPAAIQGSYLNNGLHQQSFPTTSTQQSQPDPYEYKGPSPQNIPSSVSQNTIIPGPYQYTGPSAQKNVPAAPTQHQEADHHYKGPSTQPIPPTSPQDLRGTYQYDGQSPQNLPSTSPQDLQGTYQYNGPSPQNLPATSSKGQQGSYLYKGPSPQKGQHEPSSQNLPSTSSKVQEGSYVYTGASPQNLPATSPKGQQGSYLYKEPSPQNSPAFPAQGPQSAYQPKETSSQNLPTISTQGQQNPFQYGGSSQQNFATDSSQYREPPQKPLPQNITYQTSQEYPSLQGNHQFNRPSQPHESSPGIAPQNLAAPSYKPSQKYLPPNSASQPTAGPSQLPTSSDYPRPSQHYLPPTLTGNGTSPASATPQQYHHPENEKQRELNRPTTSPLHTTATSSSTYHGPDYQYLPGTTERPPTTTTTLSLQNSGNYFSNQHWNPIKTDRNRQTTTPIPPNNHGPVALHQGYRYNTPALKENSSHSQTFNGVIYNELGMGMNTSQYFFVPRPGPLGKTEVETQQGYVYGRPESRPNENQDSVTHLIPVPTMPSSYIYYKPSQKLGDTQSPRQNLTDNHQQQQELNENSRPSDYPVQQQTPQESFGNLGPSTDSTKNHNRPSPQEILQESNGNSRPLNEYPGKQPNPSFQQTNGNASPSDYAVNQKPHLQQPYQETNGNPRPSSDYTANHERPSLQQTQQSSNGNSLPSPNNPGNHKNPSTDYIANPDSPSLQQIIHSSNGNSRPSSNNPGNHKNPYFTEQYEGSVGDSAHDNQQRPLPSLPPTKPVNTAAAHPGSPPPQYSTPEYAGNFRPSTGLPSHYQSPAQPPQYVGQASPSVPSLQLTRPGNAVPSHQGIPQDSQNQQNTPGFPNGRPTENHIYHHPGAMATLESYHTGNTGKAPSTTPNQNYQSTSALNQFANTPGPHFSPIPPSEPPRYTTPNQLTPSQQVWSQSQGSQVDSTQSSFSSNRIPSNSNSLPAAQLVSQGYYVPNQLSSPLSGYRPLSQTLQNSQLSTQNANASHITQREPQRNHLTSPGGASLSHNQVSEQDNHSYRQDYSSQVASQAISSHQSNYSFSQNSFPQLSTTPLRPPSSPITFPFNQISSQGNSNIPPVSQTHPQQSPQPSSPHNHGNISPERQRTPPYSPQYPQQTTQTPSQTFNSNYPSLPQTEMQRQRTEAQRLVSSLAQTVHQNLNAPKQFPQQAQQTFLEKPTAAPQVPTSSTISNFFGPSGNIPASPAGDEGSLNRVKSPHKPMTFVDTPAYLQMPSHSFELPSYYTMIPRNLLQALPQLPPLTTTQAPLLNKNYPLQKPETGEVGPEKKPLVFFRTSVGNSRPNPPPLAKPMIFVDSPVVPQESPIRHPHLVYGSPLHELTNIYLPPSGVVQPPYKKK